MIVETVTGGVFGAAVAIAVLFLIVALLAGGWRLLVGPSLADRVIALDMISIVMVVFLVVFKLVSGNNAYIYAGIALALISFLATVAFAHYIDRTRGDSDDG
jgi:multisubunit Na+/H+ antiporter MnhF subunit